MVHKLNEFYLSRLAWTVQ